jgi:hypothetical protein
LDKINYGRLTAWFPNITRQQRARDTQRQRARTLPDLDTQRVREHHWMRLKMKQGASSKREGQQSWRETVGNQQSKKGESEEKD